jgi:hypothetical protein
VTRSPDENHHLAQVLRLFLEHQPALRSYGLSIVRDTSLVPDVIQETVEIRAGGEKDA